MSDESKAGILLFAWVAVFNFGLLLQNAVGHLIAIFATVLTLVIVWFDWRNEKTKARLKRYTDHADEEIRRECNGSGKEL